MSRRSHRPGLRLACLTSLALSTLARSQGALDAGLQIGSKTNAAAKQEDFRSRNLVVTGDVAAGRGFRGSVGYAAEGDFRGATGGDTNVDFRRNSALSNPALATGSVGAGTSFSIGRDSVSSLEYRRDFVGPGASGTSASVVPNETSRQRLDRLSTRLSSSELRSMEGESTPMARYQGRDEADQGVLSVSEVRGVKRERDRDNITSERLSLYEAARLREDLRNGALRMDAVRARPSNPFVTQAPSDAVTTSAVREMPRPSRGDTAARPADTSGTQYDRIIREIEENWRKRGERPEASEADAAQSTEMQVGAAYEKLRGDLGHVAPQAEEPSLDIEKGIRVKSSTTPTPTQVEVSGVKLSLDDYAMLLKHGERLDAFGDGGGDRINELLAQGQRAMHEGNSFVAEKRFEVALLMKPNDPRVIAGLLHCQIAANLTGSAAITLRSLLAKHPEMMDVTYGEQALPPRDRVDRAMATVRDRLASAQRPVDDGLLLAYLGHLVDDKDAIRTGLAVVKGSPENDMLRQLLERLWLAADAKPATTGP
ncbi:MAG: hypothetical protein FJ292_00290 [Planctomycetes bacterium]|nr:hypothetical protein [Planctomycetota bacterium]